MGTETAAVARFIQTQLDQGKLARREAARLRSALSALGPDAQENYNPSEWERQADILVSLGVPSELGMSTDEYFAGLPTFTQPPEKFRGAIPLLVEARLSPKRLMDLADIDDLTATPSALTLNWRGDLGKYRTPKSAYTTWASLVDEDTTPKHRRELAKTLDSRLGTIHDGLALLFAHPKLLEDHRILMPGTTLITSLKQKYVATMGKDYGDVWMGGRGLEWNEVGNPLTIVCSR